MKILHGKERILLYVEKGMIKLRLLRGVVSPGLSEQVLNAITHILLRHTQRREGQVKTKQSHEAKIQGM